MQRAHKEKSGQTIFLSGNYKTTRTAFMNSMENIVGTHIVLAYWFSSKDLTIKVFRLHETQTHKALSYILHWLFQQRIFFLVGLHSLSFVGLAFESTRWMELKFFWKWKKIVHAQSRAAFDLWRNTHTYAHSRAFIYHPCASVVQSHGSGESFFSFWFFFSCVFFPTFLSYSLPNQHINIHTHLSIFSTS